VDHVGGLADVVALAHSATLMAGGQDAAEIGRDAHRGIRALDDGDRVRELTAVATPGHTPGHMSLLHEAASLLLIGDLVGSIDGHLSFGPPQFTADPKRRDRSLARVLGLDVQRILFSHGAEVADPIAAMRELLVEDRREPSL
jgi:glyoxylase-like metal-dependent hydrolase (beta-lactamase superfamily II)